MKIRMVENVFGKEDMRTRMLIKTGAFRNRIKDIAGETIEISSIYNVEIEREPGDQNYDEKNTVYYRQVYVCVDGNVYTSSSASFINDVSVYYNELKQLYDSDYTISIKVLEFQSNNNAGKFLKAEFVDAHPVED